MAKQAKLTLAILKPLVDQGYNTKRIAGLTGCSIRMVDRRLRSLGLRKQKLRPRIPPPGSFDLMEFQKSRDPIAPNGKMFKLNQVQSGAALQIRNACTHGVGVKAVDLERTLQRSGGGSDGMTGFERSAEDRKRLSKWKTRCKRYRVKGELVGIDIMPALLIAGHGISVRQTAIMLGMNERVASKTCKKTLDIHAKMRVCRQRGQWPDFKSEKSRVIDFHNYVGAPKEK